MKTTTIVIDKDGLLADLVKRVEAGEEVVIARDNAPVAKLVKMENATGPRKPGRLKGKATIGPEFFDPLPPEELDAWDQ
jgi:antitoxin (DNA-binding transcriptional repressor) of toxin-antitoxin stability system